METSNRKGIFFDLDDTLYDHLVPFREAVKEVLQADEEGTDFADLFHRVRHHSDALWPLYLSGEMPLEETRVRRLELAFEDFGRPLTRPQAEDIQRSYIGRQYTIEMIEGVLQHLQHLIAAGHVVGVITNGPKEHQMNKLRGLGVDKLIPPQRLFISDAVGLAKPDPQIFAYANRMTGTLPENCLYIGDTWHNDVVGALEAGWQVGWYNPRGRAPGASGHQPSFTFGSYEELAEAMEKLGF